MLDVAPTELILVAIVAIVVIGPKDLPRAMRVVGYWVGKMRGVSRQFRQGFDNMVREAELADMEKKWAEENARILREHPAEPMPAADAAPDADAPVTAVERPEIKDEPTAQVPAQPPAQPPALPPIPASADQPYLRPDEKPAA
ncbi:Sec-independent protein translocase protein TatB [Sphingomonas aracearum]|uniref:Twin-arginine translocase subunit TatB n=1 Tax=Sphingomonas aracearum TaxID=2283317 RepID=A0A369W3M3_9SPHN|nr:Sec-independent protein translocase protein TatB [Sphingomonas aracearum]RDE06661.1 twin-arginine translocase subunit TatB [Sphingomonas aracearum]